MATTGDIVVVDFPGVQGVKRRPAIIISSAEYHRTRPDVIVGLITSQNADASGPTDHLLSDWHAAGLHRPSTFRAYLMTLPKKSISATIGRPSATDWQAIVNCVAVAMGK